MTNKRFKILLSLIIFSFVILGALSCISASSDINTNANSTISASNSTNIINDNVNNGNNQNSTLTENINQTNTNNYNNNDNQILSESKESVNSNTVLTANNLTKTYGSNESFTVSLTDNNNNPIVNENINITLSNSNNQSKTYTLLTDTNGSVNLAINLNPGTYTATSTYNDSNITNTITINSASILNAKDFYETFGDGLNFTGTLYDIYGSPIVGMHIALNLTRLSDGASKIYWVTTDTEGIYKLQINLSPGNYTTKSSFYGYSKGNLSYGSASSIINNMIVYSEDLDEDDVSASTDGYATISEISSVAKSVESYIIANGTLPSTVNIDGTTYSIAQFTYLMSQAINEINSGSTSDIQIINVTNALDSPINTITGTLSSNNIVSMALRISNYIITNSRAANYDSSNGLGKISYENYAYIFAESLSYYNSHNSLPSSLYVNTSIMTKGGVTEVISTNTGSYTLTTLSWGTGGDLTKNTVLMNNIEDTSLTEKVLEASKNGTVLLTFGNGNGKTVFINAGVHGSELSSIAATFKLINTLASMNQSQINGTIYVICDLCPASATTSTRYFNGVNLNSVADTDGTVSNNLIKIAESLNVDILGDFHCTQPGGTPGTNTVFGTYSPTSESATIAKYISSSCSVSKIIYSYAGVEYTGAVEDICNLNGIPSVTCEVLTSSGIIASGSLDKSYKMMLALLSYANINI